MTRTGGVLQDSRPGAGMCALPACRDACRGSSPRSGRKSRGNAGRDLRRLARLALGVGWLVPLALVSGCAAAGTGGAAGTTGTAGTAGTLAARPAPVITTVYLVRHAEKAARPADDPPLTPAGEARARALVVALRDAGVQAIVTTQLLRTRETARPLAELLGVAPDVVAVGGSAREHAKAVAQAVREQAGKVVLVVGHSNTVSLIIEQLGGPRLPDICDNAYANLFVVHLVSGEPTRLTRADFGARLAQPSADCPGMSP